MTGMTLIVKTVARWTKLLIFLFGLYIVLFGHLSPGGGFAGGVILASSYVLLMLAYGRDFVQRDLPLAVDSKLDGAGILLFALIAVLGFAFGGTFFVNFLFKQGMLSEQAMHLLSAGTIPLSNIAIGLKVGASLFMVIFVLTLFRQEEDRTLDTASSSSACRPGEE